MRLVEYWQQVRSHFLRPRGLRTAKQPLHLESLEERTVPTILWSSAGPRTVVDFGGPVITHADVDLIFWGAGWSSSQALMDKVTDSLTTILNSPYLSGLAQYRGVSNGQLLRTDFITSTSPASRTTNALFDALVQANLNDGTLPITPDMDSQIVYLVIPQPGTTVAGARGQHDQDLSSVGRFHYAWSENVGNVDDITSVSSHELTETVTDPEPNFRTGFVIPTTHDEIGDNEAQNYTYRLNGVLVQSSLSQEDQAYAVYDGAAQRLVLTNTRALTINGDQLSDPADTITVDVVDGGYAISLDGARFQFDAGQVSSITVNTFTGDDTVIVERTLAGRAVTINLGDGNDTVSLSPTVQDLATLGGSVTVNGGAASDTLIGSAVDNTWNILGSNTGTLSSSSIAGLVSFTAMQNLLGGAGNDTFVFSAGAGITGSLDGGGSGTLDYTAYSGSVLVDLPTATATGVGGNVAHIQNVIGGAGGGAGVYNILVGTGGNTLTGGNGRRNLLIAGSSPSTLLGGDDEDVLLGGTSTYDTDVATLLAIMDYWSGSPDDFGTRVNNLLTANGVSLLDPTNVTSNGGGNTLIGGPGLNLYYGNAADASDFDPNSAAVFVLV